MHNLEHIPFEEVVNDKGISYTVFRSQLTPRYERTWFNIAAGFACVFLLVWLSVYLQQLIPSWFWLTIPVIALLTGFFIAYLNLYIHEAAHFHLHANKKINDQLSNLFLGSWTGVHIKVYRKMHWQHHLHLATPADQETSYFNVPGIKFLIESLTGIHLLKMLLHKADKQLLGKQLRQRAVRILLLAAVINGSLLFLGFYTGYWQTALMWCLAMGVFFPFFATIRQVIEHRDELAGTAHDFYSSPKTKISRLFSDSLLSRLIGPAGFNKHMLHHWDPQLPSTALKDTEQFLRECANTKEIIRSSRTTYLAVFKQLFFGR